MSSLKDPEALWRSLDELEGSPELRDMLEREFGQALGEMTTASRRRFLQLMGASLALAGASCRWDRENLHAFTRAPASHTPGEPKHFATSWELDGVGKPVMVKAYDYRPIKVDGNPRHPMSHGASDLATQATVLDLYDPDRSRHPLRNGQPTTWEEFATFARTLAGAARVRGGRTLRVLCEASSSPSLAALRDRLLATLPQARWIDWSSVSHDNAREGARLAFGRASRPLLALSEARVVLSLDDDFLGGHPAHVAYARDWARRRRPEDGALNRTYVVESRMTSTGGVADLRVALRSEQIRAFALALEAALAAHGIDGHGGALPTGGFLNEPRVQRVINALARDLAEARGQSIITVGHGQPPEVHAIAHRMNAALGNLGGPVQLLDVGDAERPTHAAALASLVEEMNAGTVEALLVLGANPVYGAPASLGFASAYAKVSERIHLSSHVDETSRVSTWHLNEAHYLESWGDARAFDGSVLLRQPVIAPLYGGKSTLEVVGLLVGASDGQAVVKETFARIAGIEEPKTEDRRQTTENRKPSTEDREAMTETLAPLPSAFERAFRAALHDGFIRDSAYPRVKPALASFTVAPLGASELRPGMPDNGALELTVYADERLHDGRFANNAWLQETPDFVTKLTWDNAALMAPATALALGVEDEQLVQLSLAGRSATLPVFRVPGMAPGSVAVAMGYGRTSAGRVGGYNERPRLEDAPVAGFDVSALRSVHATSFASGLTVTPTDERYPLASTQEHWAIDTRGFDERERRAPALVRTADVATYAAHPELTKELVEHPPLVSLWEPWEYTAQRWGMVIDLGACTGCSACVVACTAENNVPVVGKEQVRRNREMHWIRVDRYFRGPPEAPQMLAQVMLCQHCETAPCESVCPVGATAHSAEGLNDMVYNRCIGTRYCSNNCPYKVRRFNFFNYREELKEPRVSALALVHNPEVTVRSRGVMEKCTYCVQRIKRVMIPARNERRQVRDGEITPACAQACPTEAIVFGDTGDGNSRVSRLKALPRNYGVLAELHTQPRTSYLARITNPPPGLREGEPS